MYVYVVIQESSGGSVVAVASDHAKAHEIIRLIRIRLPDEKFRVVGFTMNLSPHGEVV